MSRNDWEKVTKEDVIKAIKIFLEENPDYPAPKNTFLLYEGRKLPAKHIRGMAYKIANKREISKAEYSGGMETIKFFEKLGFKTFYVGKKDVKENIKKLENKKIKEKLDVKKLEHETGNVYKIRIPSKNVIEQKNALQLLLNKMFNGDIVCEKTYSWLKTPEYLDDDYKKIFNALIKYRGNKNFAKKNVALKCDFVCESQKLIIEYDERQHFSEARKIALQAYPNFNLEYDKSLWIKACDDIQAKDNQPINRDEIRAYYDSVRDIEAKRHGYKLVRIMHGQVDFLKSDAEKYLHKLLGFEKTSEFEENKLKIGLYLQTEQCRNNERFDEDMGIVKKSNIDILVFPENCYLPFEKILTSADIVNEDDLNNIFNLCLNFSNEIGKAVIINSYDKCATIFSIFANAYAKDDETECSIYIKHTKTAYSAFDFKNYKILASNMFIPIIYKDYKIGMTICYDCNHSIFSRMYGIQNVDIIINSTGGNVIYDKWYKYNQARAIENSCYTFITMGGDDEKENINSWVYGFNRRGKALKPCLLNYDSNKLNIPGGIYVYDLQSDDDNAEIDHSINQEKTVNKYQDFLIKVDEIDDILKAANEIYENLYVYKYEDKNIVFILVKGEDIFSVEKFLPLLYSEKLKQYDNRRYIIINDYDDLTEEIYERKLSVILKVRAMENYSAVILKSNLVNQCYQTGKNRTAQVLKSIKGVWGLDLSRMSGPETIWKNKDIYTKAKWRENFNWLISNSKDIANGKNCD